jgi:N-acyl-D-aspartate/D-glutamate deacylase
MVHFDTLIRNGRIIDGTGAAGFDSDLGIINGRIAAIGKLQRTTADQVIEADGKTVAPGFIDSHTHYDIQLYWDPYCSTSGEHGVTTVVTCNCGFGLAPCRLQDRIRYMRMMDTTEEIPFDTSSKFVSWTWESFPEYLAELRRIPKGVNVMSFMPFNPLLIYVMGDAVKRRRPNTEELQQMRDLLSAAMDAGACGISMSYMGKGNNHTDADGSDMPTDVMHPDDAIAVCEVLKERGDGIIQCLSQIGRIGDRTMSARLAKEVGRPVLHNVFESNTRDPGSVERDLAWLAELEAQKLDVYVLSFMNRAWGEGSFKSMAASLSSDPGVREIFALDSDAQKIALLGDTEFRARWRASYSSESLIGTPIETTVITDLPDNPEIAGLIGRSFGELAAERGVHVVDVLAEVAYQTRMNFRIKTVVFNGAEPNPHAAKRLLSNPRVIPGNSDGGAHIKSTSMGNYTTDLLLWLSRETRLLSQEEMHYRMSCLPARALQLQDRGVLRTGYAADIILYDLEKLYFDRKGYTLMHDLPDGDWRLVARSGGYAYTLVNGVVTHVDGRPTGATPGRYVSASGGLRS